MPKEYDTMNHFVIGTTGDGTLVSHVLRRSFTKDQALNLAAYLVVISGVEREEFNGLVSAIEGT